MQVVRTGSRTVCSGIGNCGGAMCANQNPNAASFAPIQASVSRRWQAGKPANRELRVAASAVRLVTRPGCNKAVNPAQNRSHKPQSNAAR